MKGLLLIGLFLIGCSDNFEPAPDCNDCGLELYASNLQIESDGSYKLEYNQDLTQTYTMLDATTDCGWSQHLQWETDYQYQITEGQWTSLVNPGSMTDENGDAHVMFSAWEDFIGYTVTVQCGYTDECGVHYLESIKIKVVDEE
tara:strand:+ start:224 stop:655 length:432 start_codon:yes stop_codon:yes gene_type:complete